MNIDVGKRVWIACEVKPGPFSDEPMVRVQTEEGDWLGFVPFSALKQQITQGRTFVRGIVTGVVDDQFTAALPGHAVTPFLFKGAVSKVTRDPVQA